MERGIFQHPWRMKKGHPKKGEGMQGKIGRERAMRSRRRVHMEQNSRLQLQYQYKWESMNNILIRLGHGAWLQHSSLRILAATFGQRFAVVANGRKAHFLWKYKHPFWLSNLFVTCGISSSMVAAAGYYQQLDVLVLGEEEKKGKRNHRQTRKDRYMEMVYCTWQ